MPEQVVKVFTRRTSDGQISMWGTLHLNTQAEGSQVGSATHGQRVAHPVWMCCDHAFIGLAKRMIGFI